MLIKEFRVTLPVTVPEYQVGQLHAVAEASKNETGGGDGVEVLKNEPYVDHPKFGNGQYTYKIYHLKHKVPGWVRALAPAGALELHEEAWNSFPYCKTVLTNPDYMKEGMTLTISSWHKADRGQLENVHDLNAAQLEKREIIPIDIANDPINPSDYKEEFDPKKYNKPRGPLTGNWKEACDPVMTCYKLVEIEFKWRFIQGKVEQFIADAERKVFTNFHRQVFCSHYMWADMTMDDIRAIEDKTKKELDEQRAQAGIRGTTDQNY